MDRQEIQEILERYKVIAFVGLSKEPTKPSYRVASYMKEKGYRIIPVNPFVDEVLGEKSYKSILDMPAEVQKSVDIVNIFRRPEDVPPIIEQAIKLKNEYDRPYVIWMQVGIVNEEAAETARKAGLFVVMDRCIMVEHRNLQVTDTSALPERK